MKIVGWIYSKFVSKFIYKTHEYMCAMQWRIGVKNILYQSSNYRQIFGKTTLDMFPWNIIGHLSNDGQKFIFALAVLKKTLVTLCELCIVEKDDSVATKIIYFKCHRITASRVFHKFLDKNFSIIIDRTSKFHDATSRR